MNNKIRWGIVGAGGIARRFAQACSNAKVENAELVGIASRNIDKAQAFADDFEIAHAFGSYEEMAKSDLIDAAYIATPHGLHAEYSKLFMNNGKAVLCEKPITLNTSELESMFDCAKKNNVFLMEAMWPRMVPGTKKLIEMVENGVFGKIKGIQGSFSFDMSDEPDHHAFDPKYGGGSILDVGCYGLSFASWYSNSPVKEMKSLAELSDKGVDVHCCTLISYEDGAIASLSSGMLLRKPNEGYLFGEKGYVYVDHFYAPEKLEIHLHGKDVEILEYPYLGNGFEEQIIEASKCISEGKVECSYVPHEQSMFICSQMDEIRKEVGVKYPCDNW